MSVLCPQPESIHTQQPPAGFNAPAGLFFVNPYVVVVTEEDREDPEYFFAMLELRYAFVMPLHVSCRLLVVDPRIMSMPTLAASKPRAKRTRTHKHRAGKRHKGGKAGVAAGEACM